MPDDFNDSLDDLIGNAPRKAPAPTAKPFVPVLERPEYQEGCPACRGTGLWRGIRGRPCFKCDGRGSRTFKTSPESRAKGRARAAAKAAEREADKAAWRDAHKAEIAWLTATADRQRQRQATGQSVWEWPISVCEKLGEYGTLTDGQLAVVQERMTKDAERKAVSVAKLSSAIDASKIEAAFAVAREKAARPGAMGVWTKPLKLRGTNEHQSFALDLTFQAGSVGSQWEGMIFVKSGDRKLGVIKNGVFTRRFECNDAEVDLVTRVCADPLQAAKAYGKAWSVCTVCGQTLTNDESIARGIGPICAEKYGW